MLKSPTFTEKGTCENGDKGFLKLPMKISDSFVSTRDLYDLVGFTCYSVPSLDQTKLFVRIAILRSDSW